MPELDFETCREELERAEREVNGVLESLPNEARIRVREGGGLEDIYASLAISVTRIESERQSLKSHHHCDQRVILSFEGLFDQLNQKIKILESERDSLRETSNGLADRVRALTQERNSARELLSEAMQASCRMLTIEDLNKWSALILAMREVKERLAGEKTRAD